ncbi:MAG: flagellar M-ring protein FliF, partial [Deltaproteobacteria bacterium]|nr:flagellar M-ring protein FliF [Deltaproteobacteria bacterium]
MNFDIGAVFGQIITLFTRLPLSQKIALPFLFAGSMFAIVFISQWAGRPDYAVLFSGLKESDAAGIVEKLKDDKIAYQIDSDGTTVRVSPPELVHELRLELASAGLPKGGSVGFELLDANVLGRTGFMEKLAFMRGQQGELERTIQSLDAVKSVRVHVTSPERSSFVKRDVLPTASVLLRLKVGQELTKAQIKGIANLVAHSVERLTPENVSIIDSQGNLLNERRSEDESGGADLTRLEYVRNIEATFSKQIESMLAGVLGPGRAIARVTAAVDFNAFQREEESFDPGSKVARSERAVDEAAGGTAEGGTPGVISNLQNNENILSAPSSAGANNRRRESVTNYEVSRAVSKTIAAPGKVERLSVAVLVDGQHVALASAAAGAEAAKQYKPLTPEMIQKIENLVKQSVGFDGSRGDTVTVENMRFFEPDQSLEEVLGEAETMYLVEKFASWIVPGVVIILFFFVVLRPLVRFLVNPTDAQVDLSRLLPAGIEELEA